VNKITVLQFNKSKKRVSIFLDDSSSFVIDRQVVEDAGLRKGLDLSESQMKELMEADLSRRCLDAALRFLTYRPRSELEMKQRLRRRGFRDETISKILVRLREQNLINDAVFAQYWKDSRLSLNPKSRRLIKHELRRKGIYGEVADEATGDVDDSANAYKAGLKKARLMSSLGYEEFRRKLSNYLKWRGFSYGVISSVSERLWQEKQDLLK
jgi:regulatory protein